MLHRLPIFLLSTALLMGGLVGVSSVASAQEQEDSKLRLLLGQGWTFMEHGNLNQAEASFTEAFGLPSGPNTAETYYAMAAVWWERRNAMAAYMWLTDATEAAKKSYTWNGGPDLDWDRRISMRRRFIEGNFTVVKLRSPARGKPIPPLADQPPGDPTLAQFSALLPKVVADGVAAKVAVQWVMIPNGTYWIGDKLVPLDSGELDASEAKSWDLLPDRGKARKTYAYRLRELSEGRSPAREAADGQASDALAREEQRRELEAQRLEEDLRREQEAAAERAELERRQGESQRQLEEERRAQEEQARIAQAEAEAEAEARLRKEQAEETKRLEAEARRAERERLKTQKKAEKVAEAEARRAQEEARKAEEDRLALERREEKRAQAARAAEERKKAKELEAAAAAEAKRQELASKEAAAEQDENARRQRREELVKARSQGKTPPGQGAGSSFLERKFFFAGGVGPALVEQIKAEGSLARAEWSASGEFGGLISLKGVPFSVAVAVSYANLPVSGCSSVQTRSSLLSVHAGVRLPVQIRDKLWFAFRGGMHVGGGGSWPSGEARASCGTGKLAAEDLLYGVRLEGEGGSGRLSYSALGWNGYSLVLGPDLDATVFFGLGAQTRYLGVGFFLRHDQLLAAVRPDSYHFEIDGTSSPDLETVRLDYFDPRASMARLQLGFRATLVF